jgi:hypothetical protein
MTNPDDAPSTPPSANGVDHSSEASELSSSSLRPGSIASQSTSSPLPFVDLKAPEPVAADPPAAARWLAFGSILIGGLLGAMIGYGTTDLLSGQPLWVGAGLLVGALTGAIGVGIVAGLTLRAMNEWKTASHPEAAARDRAGFELRRPLRTDVDPDHRRRD